MVVEGAVVMVENIVRYLGRKREEGTALGSIREAAHEVQRPVFYSIGIIITAYLPIFTLQRVEGRLFKPMAWTVSFALLGSLLFSMIAAPVVSSLFFGKHVREWHNPAMVWMTLAYRRALHLAIRLRWLTLAVAVGAVALSWYLTTSGVIGSEFLPHLDEGAIWARATLAPSTGPTEGARVMGQARVILASFPEVTQVVSQVDAPTMARIPPASSIRSTLSISNPRRSGGPCSSRTKRNSSPPWIGNWRRCPARYGISPSPSPTTWRRR